jgi:hypothetical protein
MKAGPEQQVPIQRHRILNLHWACDFCVATDELLGVDHERQVSELLGVLRGRTMWRNGRSRLHRGGLYVQKLVGVVQLAFERAAAYGHEKVGG